MIELHEDPQHKKHENNYNNIECRYTGVKNSPLDLKCQVNTQDEDTLTVSLMQVLNDRMNEISTVGPHRIPNSIYFLFRFNFEY